MAKGNDTAQKRDSTSKRPRASTLSDIAEYAGVSRTAASVVLNNSRSTLGVSAEKRQRILQAAKELNYYPNVVAQALTQGRTNVIGFYSSHGDVFDPMFPFYGMIIKGLLEGCEEHNNKCLLHGTFRGTNEEDLYTELVNGQIDGLVLYCPRLSPLVERLIQSRLPVITVADEIPGLPGVVVDDGLGGRIMARQLAAKGYKRALFWAPRHASLSSINTRLEGFLSEAKSHAMEVELFHPLTDFPSSADFDSIWGRNQPPEVIVTFNDFEAYNILKQCQRKGIRIPRDLAVTGFDGFEFPFPVGVELTTIRAPWDEVARTAVRLLIESRAGSEIPARTVIPVEWVEGKTT